MENVFLRACQSVQLSEMASPGTDMDDWAGHFLIIVVPANQSPEIGQIFQIDHIGLQGN
jgi:hypothetical protein